MADKQFGLSSKEIEILKDQAARRLANRQTFIKEIHNPHRFMNCIDEPLFDSAIQRYLSMQVSHIDHFKPTARSTLVGFMLVILPMSALVWVLKKERGARLEQYSTGQVAYRDRRFKLV